MSAEGQACHCRSFLVIAAPGAAAHPRLGVTVTLKINKRAVVRNRIKRRIREVFRLNQARIEPVDIVVIARRDSPDCDFKEISRQILGALKRGGWLK